MKKTDKKIEFKEKIEIEKPAEEKKKVIFTAEQQRIASLVESADTSFPEIEVSEYLKRTEMEIPRSVKKPEFSYRWIWEGNLNKELHSMGGIFEIVTRSNHSHASSKLFGIMGAITYKGENILCFTRKKIASDIANQITADFNRKTERAENASQEYHGGKISIGRVDGDGSGGYNEQELAPEAKYESSPE